MSPPTPKLRWRPATAADWDAAWAIQRAAFLDLVTRTWGGWDAVQEAKCRDAWDPARTHMLEVEGAVVGWVRRDRRDDHDWLDLVVIDPSLHGRGLGTRVMQRLLAEAAARGVPLWLSVYRENAARRLYTRLGFRELPRDALRVHMVWPAETPGPPPA